MLLRGIGRKGTEYRRPVPCFAQVTLNSARRRQPRWTGPWDNQGLSPRWSTGYRADIC